MIPLAQPEQFNDALTEVLRDGAARLLAATVEAEVKAHLAAYSDLRLCRMASNLSARQAPAADQSADQSVVAGWNTVALEAME